MPDLAKRGLRREFLAELQAGFLCPLAERVRADETLCLEIRENYINIYYRGGNLLKVSPSSDGYRVFFDTNYAGKGSAPSWLPDPLLQGREESVSWAAAMPQLKEAMDLFFGRHPKEEREIQQLIVRDNNFGGLARATDYFVCDIEYASSHGRFDIVAVEWPSTSPDRKRQDGRRLVFAEVKQGDRALDGKSGLHEHIEDVNAHLSDPANAQAIKEEMVRVFNQKRALGLVDCGKDLGGFGDQPPLFLLIFANHDPEKSRLRELLKSLPECPHAELRIVTSSLMGYGLYQPCMQTVDEALSRFGDRI